MSGPVGIFDRTISILLNENGVRLVLGFYVLLNVNLAILNLMPIPILDGGHIMFSFVEWIRRRPLSVKVMYGVQTAFFVVFIGFFLFVTFFDVKRIGKSIQNYQETEAALEAAKIDPVFKSGNKTGENEKLVGERK
jgi:membrane-associated protease RseP (regulator of RpoE activity)